MKRCFYWFALLGIILQADAQQTSARLEQKVQQLLADAQMKHALLGFSVVNAQTGAVVYAHNPETGLAPASCQKIVTAATAMDVLGGAYRYKTILGYSGQIRRNTLDGDLWLLGSGDPSLGSWRYQQNGQDSIRKQIIRVMKQAGIRKVNGKLSTVFGNWERSTLPGGWIWDDIGNYYGAGAAILNWHENQYDLHLRSGDTVDASVEIIDLEPQPVGIQLSSELKAGPRGSGDNAYIYLPPFAKQGVVRGTIPAGEKAFTISGSFPDPMLQTLATVYQWMDTAGIAIKGYGIDSLSGPSYIQPLCILESPSLDSLVYWFMRKSINLYGEALLKTLAAEMKGLGETEKGTAFIRSYWKERGIDPGALQVRDGSGLSPQNRITASALIKILQYAKTKPWFPAFYDALPVYNQMKLKSGSIGGARSFAGYHTAKDGTQYIVAIIVNGYEGSSAEVVKKMFGVLDELK
jgi:D-alanyl-D-alanine carboxypeptidase/D-alanyl-D-alanine-endopeptidase (penicillin-binding protein 4)